MFPEVILTKIFAYRREFWLAAHRQRFAPVLQALCYKYVQPIREVYPSDSYYHCYFD